MLFIGSPSALYDKTNPDWAPTQNMGHEKIKNIKIACERNERAKVRGVKRKIAEAAKASEEPSDDQLDDEPEHEIIEPLSLPVGKQIKLLCILFLIP